MSKKIVIASLLKPTDDVRVYSKIAQSLAKTNKYEVNIIGNKGKSHSIKNNIQFHPHLLKRNDWLKRILLREILFLKILNLKPDILIITTYELINSALLVKLFTGTKIIYDVQENYAANTKIKKGIFRKLNVLIIRFQEWFASRFIDQYWLAEVCYSQELNLSKNSFISVENKAKKTEFSVRKFDPLRMLFSGTISEYSGANLALQTMIHFTKKEPESKGIFIGQVHDLNLLKDLKKSAKKFPSIEFVVSQNPIAHSDILDKIKWANLGIISYQPNNVNRNKIPTKLYEYSRYLLPYLIQENTIWSKKGHELGGAIPIDFGHIAPIKLPQIIRSTCNLFPKTYPKESTWEYESKKIIDSIDKLINYS